MNSFVCREFQPTAKELLNNFRKFKSEANGTHTPFASRLLVNFQYYRSLHVVNNFEDLCQLIISEKIFHILDKETSRINVNVGEKPNELAKEVDICCSLLISR